MTTGVLREVVAGELPALFSMLASSKHRRFFVRIPDTIFLNSEGMPVAKLSTRVYDGQAMVMKWSQEELSGATLRGVAQEIGDYRLDPKAPPLTRDARAELIKTHSSVARFANTNALMTQAEFDRLLDELAAGNLPYQETPHGRELQAPYCLQQYIAPLDDLRYITTYLWSDTRIVCESFACSASRAYAGTAAERAGTASAGSGVGYTYAVPEEIAVQLRTSTLGAVSFIKKMHSCQLMGLVVEHVFDEKKNLWLNMILAVCWPEMWHRQRTLNPAGEFKATIPIVPVSIYPEGPVMPPDSPELRSLSLSASGGPFDKPASARSHPRRQYGLDSPLAAVIAAQPGQGAGRKGASLGRTAQSLPGIAASRHACERPISAAKEALAAAREHMMRTTGAAPTFAPYGLTARGNEVPLIAQLSRRLEETRDELQAQCHAAAYNADRARHFDEVARKAEIDRSAAVRDLEAFDSRYQKELHAWGAKIAELQMMMESATTQLHGRTEDLAAAAEERDRLRARLDYERDVAFDVTGDLRQRLDATMAENAELKRIQTLHEGEKRELGREIAQLRSDLAELQATLDKIEGERGSMKDEAARNRQALIDHDKVRTYLPHVSIRCTVGPDEIADIIRMDGWPLIEHFSITGLFAMHANAIKEVFGHYANIRDYVGDKRGLQELMGWPEFTVFCRECFGFEQVIVDQLFVKANFNTGTVSTGNARLEYGEFLEVLVRLAQLRSPLLPCSSDRVRDLIEKVIEPALKRVRSEKRDALLKGGGTRPGYMAATKAGAAVAGDVGSSSGRFNVNVPGGSKPGRDRD